MKIYNYSSPNFDNKNRTKNLIKFIVIHYTGMQSERESINKLCNPKTKVSSHFLINRVGKIYRLVQENKTAWHAGKSSWKGYKNLNKNSIGIELVNLGHQFGYQNFTKKQLKSLITICLFLIKKYKIKSKNIIGHSDIAPLRKEDPGEKFPWQNLSKKKIGIWHNCKSSFLKKLRKNNVLSKNNKKKFIKYLNKIGYSCEASNKLLLFKVIKAFQRHFRKELINGIIDKECFFIAQNLSKKL